MLKAKTLLPMQNSVSLKLIQLQLEKGCLNLELPLCFAKAHSNQYPYINRRLTVYLFHMVSGHNLNQ